MPFKESVSTSAYLKLGSLGLNKSGKTYTSGLFAIGLHKYLVDLKLRDKKQPVYFNDTETGSDWLIPLFKEHGVRLMVDKTRSFTALVENMDLVAEENGIMIIDSITHYWRELVENYARKKNKDPGKLAMNDWNAVKNFWKDYTDRYVNQPAHYMMLGRQGYEYDISEDEEGRKTIEKSGIKLKAEAETGYEPSLIIVMERHQKIGSDGRVAETWREGHVIGDRSTVLDGKSFRNPTFNDILPHVERLSLGSEHVGVDNRTSDLKIPVYSNPEQGFKYEAQQREIWYEEIDGLLKSKWPGSSADNQAYRKDMLAKHLKSRSEIAIKNMSAQVLKNAYNLMHLEIYEVPAPGCEDLPTTDGDLTDFERSAKELF
jgi:hypothetical protein